MLTPTTKSLIFTTLLTLTTAQYFYPAVYTPSSSAEDDSSPNSAEYIELVRVPRAMRPYHQNQPSLIPSSPLPPRVGAPGGIPLPAINHRHSAPHYPYEPMAMSGSKPPRIQEPLATAESHGHGHHHGHDYVDYGAYTGGWGAFGWYTDHPVHGH